MYIHIMQLIRLNLHIHNKFHRIFSFNLILGKFYIFLSMQIPTTTA